MKYKLFFTVLLIALVSVPVRGGELSNAEIKSLLSGKTAIGEHRAKGFSLKNYYASDGTFISIRGKNTKRKGKWWMAKNTDAVCVRFRNQKGKIKNYCRGLRSDGKGGYILTKPDSDANIHYHKIVDGKQI